MSALNELSRQTEAARMLRASLRDAIEDDEDMARDMVEGSTNLIEAVHAAVERLAELKGLRAGLKTASVTLKARDDRLAAQEQRLRDALVVALDLAGLSRLECPVGTVSRRPVPPSVIVTDEHAIAPGYWVEQDPKLDKRKLLEALKSLPPGEHIAGAELSNGGFGVTVRFT